MELECGACVVRPWRKGDESALVRHADNYRIWQNLRDAFPHPYTYRDAEWWVEFAASQVPQVSFAIEVDGEAAGGIGLVPGTDVERIGAEVGYWLGEAHWGRGIVTVALTAFSEAVFDQFDLVRLFALPFIRNEASIRVLEKAGYHREGVLRCSAVKEGIVLDQILYARLRE